MERDHDTVLGKIKDVVIGKPKDLEDTSIFHRLSLVPFLAWVGLGADGLSSSAYGPEETFKALGEHTYLAVVLMVLMAFTIFIISAAYSRIIEAFPHGGGGYVVASKLLGRKTGMVSGCALLIDYILTITISIAAAGDALFSFLPPEFLPMKLPCEVAFITCLIMLNLRGVRESVVMMAPIFLLFLVTHGLAIGWGIFSHLAVLPDTVQSISQGFSKGTSSIGTLAMIMLIFHAWSLGGGTYTGIEAVSSGLPLMREPRVHTGKVTMLYMAVSLAITASGLLFCYLLWNVTPVEGKTMNAVFLENLAGSAGWGRPFVITALLTEGFILVVAAQAGFIGGPRVMANMAIDSWVPKWLAALSDRLTTANGVLLMGATSLAALLYTNGEVSHLVVMYSINVFLTFSLSIGGMLRQAIRSRRRNPRALSDLLIFGIGFLVCLVILVITVKEKFGHGGWVTLAGTGSLVVICLLIRRHYMAVAKKLTLLNMTIGENVTLPKLAASPEHLDPRKRTAAILVAGFGGLGVHTLRTIIDTFPGVFHNFLFISIGVVDSGGFKGEGAVESLRIETEKGLAKYVDLSRKSGIATDYRYSIGTDIIHEGRDLCRKIVAEFPQTTFFAGKIVFEDERWYHRLLHNETALSLQKRLQLDGLTMVVLPARVA